MPPRILVVEDYPEVRKLLVGWLETAGYTVVAAIDVAGASFAPRPELIVADHELPDGTSIDIAAVWPDVPMIVASGYPAPAGHLGPWLQKPVLQPALLAAVRRALGAEPA